MLKKLVQSDASAEMLLNISRLLEGIKDQIQGGSFGSARATVSDTAPVDPSEGDLWFDTLNNKYFIFANNTWTEIKGEKGDSGEIFISNVAPLSPEEGDLWFDTTDGIYSIFLSGYWVEIIGKPGEPGPAGADGFSISVSTTPPDSPTEGQVWYDSSSALFFIFVSGAWLEVIGSQGPAGTGGSSEGADLQEVWMNSGI